VVEPVLYSQGAGLSKVALLVAIGFWTWLWGPIGLILATPLTVGFVVLAKYLPALEPVAVLLGAEPALAPPAVFYQRLVDRDVDEAAEVVERRLETSSLASVADEILIPALAGVRRDRATGRLDEADQQFVVAAMRDILAQTAGPATDRVRTPAARLLACPVRDHIDAAALEILRRVLGSTGCAMEVLPAGLLSAEMVDRVTHHRPALVVVASVPPGGLAQTRHVLKHLRSACPDLTILVGRWGASGEGDAERSALPGVGADHVATSLGETHHQIQALLPAPAARLAA
jgi:hypothetical protein